MTSNRVIVWTFLTGVSAGAALVVFLVAITVTVAS